VQCLQNEVLRTTGNFSKAHTGSRFTHGEVMQNQKMQKFTTLYKANRDTGNIRGLILSAVNHTTVQVNRLVL
jgi:hypothetical protein